MSTYQQLLLGFCAFLIYLTIEYFIFIQDRTTRKYRTTITTILDKPLNISTLENISNIHGTQSGVLNILYAFRYNIDILETQVKTQKGKQKIKDYIIQTVDKDEIKKINQKYYFQIYSEEDKQRQIAFLLLQDRLYFTFEKINDKLHVRIHFVHSDTTFAREYIYLNIEKYNEFIESRKILIFRNKYVMIDKDFEEAKSKIEALLREIAIHKDTRQKLVKEVGALELKKYIRDKEVEEIFLEKKEYSATTVYLLSSGDVKKLNIVAEPRFKDNTAYVYVIRNYILITAGIYSFLTVIVADFIVKKRKLFKNWLAKQNI